MGRPAGAGPAERGTRVAAGLPGVVPTRVHPSIRLAKVPVVTTWEYATAPLISHALQQILNQWGEQGWELVTVADNVAYFKRPVQDQ